MPKTSVDENDLPPARKDDVRLPRELLLVEGEAISDLVEQTSHIQFWLRIFRSDRLHYSPSPSARRDDRGNLTGAGQWNDQTRGRLEMPAS